MSLTKLRSEIAKIKKQTKAIRRERKRTSGYLYAMEDPLRAGLFAFCGKGSEKHPGDFSHEEIGAIAEREGRDLIVICYDDDAEE